MRRVNDEVLANDDFIVLSEECMYAVEGGECNHAKHYQVIGGFKVYGYDCGHCEYCDWIIEKYGSMSVPI